MSSFALSYVYSSQNLNMNRGDEIEGQVDRIVRTMERKFAMIESRLAGLENGRIRKSGIICDQDIPVMKRQCSYGPNDKSASLSHQLAQSVTAIAGLKEALTSERRWLRYIWTIVFFLGVGATMFYLYSTTDEYLKKPTATSTEMVIDEKYSFPPLLLCPQAWFDTEKALNLGMSLDALKYSLSYLDDSFPSQVTNVTLAREEFLSVYTTYGFDSLLNYYTAISNDFVSAMDDDKSMKSTYWCRGCERETGPVHTLLNHRFCYVFQLLPVEQLFGTYSAIRSINISFRDRTMGLSPTPTDWQVYFNKLTDSFIAIYPKVTIRPFHFNTVIFSTSKMITLNKPQAPCMDVTDSGEYCSVKCMTQCHNKMYKNYLNCSLLWLSSPSTRPSPNDSCNFMDTLPHNNWTLNKFFYSQQNGIIDSAAATVCVDRCPRECERTTLDTTLQLQEKLSESDKRQALASVGGTDAGRVQVLSVCVKHGAVYSGGMKVLTEKRTYSFTQLVNNIGGTLGLFVGATVMTFAQLILFVLQYFSGYRRGTRVTAANGTTVKA